jgi:ATP-dependent DNA ligase
LQTDRHSFELGDAPKKTRDIRWARPELVAKIELAEFTASGKIQHGTFKGLRLDKTAEELRAEGASARVVKLLRGPIIWRTNAHVRPRQRNVGLKRGGY